MSTQTIADTTTPVPVPMPLSRRVLGALAPVGPLAMAGWALAIPYHVLEEPAEWIPKVAGDLGRTQLAMWMLLIFALTAGAGAIVTGLVARRGAVKLGTTGLVLTFLGFSALNFSSGTYDGAAGAAMNSGLDVAATEDIVTELDSFQALTIGGAVFLPLMFVGVILLGLALWRGRAVPRWAAGALIVAFPVVLVGGFVSMLLNALGWALMAVGFGAAGAVYSRSQADGPHRAVGRRAQDA